MYSTTNPGGIGHGWYRSDYIIPFQQKQETDTRFIQALVTDNKYIDKSYIRKLDNQVGWKKKAWRYGEWDIAIGQYFTNFRQAVHMVEDFDDSRGVEWFAALDYGFRHYTVVLLGCQDSDGNIFIVDEHAERLWLPEQHARAINEMFGRHGINTEPPVRKEQIIRGISFGLAPMPVGYRMLSRFSAGTDVFSRQSDGSTIAQQYIDLGLRFTPANVERVNGWAEILSLLGDPDRGLPPRLFIHKRCARLLDCLPTLQHDPNHPEDVLKVDVNEDGAGGDDTADALRYLVATKPAQIQQCKLRGL